MLGDTYNNNKSEKKNFEPVVYSDYKMSNIDGLDPSILSPSFWNGMLKLTIAPRKNTGKPDEVAFDYDNGISSYLTHTKARMLYNEIVEFQKNPAAYVNMGVNSGSGLISISNGKEYGVDTPCLVIKKINGETSQIECSYAYQFKTDYHFSVRNFDEKTSEFDKFFYANLEIEQLKDLLKSYYEAMTGSIAYSVINQTKYDFGRVNGRLEGIAEALGVKGKGGNNGGKSSSSMFVNGGRSSSGGFNQSSLDDINAQIGDDD